MPITRIYFLFLICEIKCDAIALDVANRQNAYSITIVIKDIVELYKTIKREKELHRKILIFSISHDHRLMRIYNYYAIIEKEKITFYRHPIHKFNFIALDDKKK